MAWEPGNIFKPSYDQLPPQATAVGSKGVVVSTWPEKSANAHAVEVVCPPMTTKVLFSEEVLHYKYGNDPEHIAAYIAHTMTRSLFEQIKVEVEAAIQQMLKADLQKMAEFKNAYLGKPFLAFDPSEVDAFLGSAALHKPNKASTLGSEVMKTLTALVPGVAAMVAHPPSPEDTCTWASQDPRPLNVVIMHLNDHHRWTRERIADWLETLDVDLSFKTPEGDG